MNMPRTVLATFITLTLAAAAWAQPAPSTTSPTSPASSASSTVTPSKKALLQIGVRPFSGSDPRVAKVVSDAFVEELRKLSGATVVSLDDVEALLDHEAQKQLAGCSQESCLAEIAEALGVDVLVTGSLVAVEGVVAVDVRRLHPGEGRAVGVFNQRVTAAGGEESLAVVGPCVERLFPELPLRMGAVRGVDPELSLLLRPPPLDPWMTGTIAAVGVVGLVTTGVAGAVNATLVGQLQQGGVHDNATYRNQQQQLTASGVTAIAAGSVTAFAAIASVVALGFTDWTGARAEAAALAPAR